MQGAIRLAIVSCLAVVAMLAVSAIARSARPPLGEHPAVALYPMILGMTLIAADPSSPITRYPLLIIGSIVFILLMALVIARDHDMQPRRYRGTNQSSWRFWVPYPPHTST